MSTQPPDRTYVVTMACITFIVAWLAIGAPLGIAAGWPWFVWVPASVLAGLVTGTIAYRIWRASNGD